MKKRLHLLACIIMVATAATAQKGNNQLTVMAEAGIPNEGRMGYGLFIKGAYGVGEKAQLTLQTGFSRFTSAGAPGHQETTIRIIPFLAGYKYNIKNFYIEPQAGYGEVGGRIDIGGDYARPSNGAFIWAIGGGYSWPRIDLGIRYQSAHGTVGIGSDHKNQFGFTGLHIGYNLIRQGKTSR